MRDDGEERPAEKHARLFLCEALCVSLYLYVYLPRGNGGFIISNSSHYFRLVCGNRRRKCVLSLRGEVGCVCVSVCVVVAWTMSFLWLVWCRVEVCEGDSCVWAYF